MQCEDERTWKISDKRVMQRGEVQSTDHINLGFIYAVDILNVICEDRVMQWEARSADHIMYWLHICSGYFFL